MFTNMRLVITLNHSLKMMASFANVARTTATRSKFIYILGKILNHLEELGLSMKNNF